MRKWLIELRKHNGMSQSAIAELLEISQPYYAQIERAERQADLTLSVAAKIADIFNIPLSTIRNYEEALAKEQ